MGHILVNAKGYMAATQHEGLYLIPGGLGRLVNHLAGRVIDAVQQHGHLPVFQPRFEFALGFTPLQCVDRQFEHTFTALGKAWPHFVADGGTPLQRYEVVIALLVGGIHIEINVSLQALQCRAAAVMGLACQLEEKIFHFGEHSIDQIFAGIKIVEHCGNRDTSPLGNFGMASAAYPSASKYGDGMSHQLTITFVWTKSRTATLFRCI